MNQLPIQRILVALDASADSLAALAAAANLAAALKAELIGLFVEDIDLLRMAKLPYAQEVRYPVAVTQQVDTSKMEQQLRVRADQARRELRKVAEKLNVSWSFRVARGSVIGELLNAASEADLLALGRVSHAFIPTARLGSTAKTAVTEAPGPVLLMRPGVDLNRPVLLIYDGSTASQRALSAATYLAKMSGRLQVLICASDNHTAQQYETHIDSELRYLDVKLTYRRQFQLDPSTLAYILSLSGVDLLVFGGISQLPADSIQAMLEMLDHPVLVVR